SDLDARSTGRTRAVTSAASIVPSLAPIRKTASACHLTVSRPPQTALTTSRTLFLERVEIVGSPVDRLVHTRVTSGFRSARIFLRCVESVFGKIGLGFMLLIHRGLLGLRRSRARVQ